MLPRLTESQQTPADTELVFRYLEAIKLLTLMYPTDGDFDLTGERNANCSEDHDDRRSSTGYFSHHEIQGKRSELTNLAVAVLSLKGKYRVWAAAVQEATILSLEVTVMWIGLSADSRNDLWWRHSELHRTGYQPCDTYQKIETRRHPIFFNLCTCQLINWQLTWWQSHCRKLKLSKINKFWWINCRFLISFQLPIF